MMKQFRAIKEQYPDAMLLFRCGDFYETYAEDAVRASKILQITLTHRSNGGQGSGTLEMAGFPFHALDTYLPKLVRAGLRVAICDQLEDPKLTKKLVKRGVTELVTPGVSYSDTTLQSKENNFVACVHFSEGKGPQQIGAAFLDLSTGEFLVGQGTEDYVSKLLTNLKPKEVLYLRGKRERFESAFAAILPSNSTTGCSPPRPPTTASPSSSVPPTSRASASPPCLWPSSPREASCITSI